MNVKDIPVLIKRMFNNLVEYVEHQEQKTDSELEGDYLEKYYKCMIASSNKKKGGLNDQDVERIGHEFDMLWNEFEKEHRELCTKERATTPESELEEDDIYYEDQAVLDVGLARSDLIGTDASTTVQVERSCTSKEGSAGSELAKYENDKAVIKEFEDQSRSSDEENLEDKDDISEDLVIITSDDFLQIGKPDVNANPTGRAKHHKFRASNPTVLEFSRIRMTLSLNLLMQRSNRMAVQPLRKDPVLQRSTISQRGFIDHFPSVSPDLTETIETPNSPTSDSLTTPQISTTHSQNALDSPQSLNTQPTIPAQSSTSPLPRAKGLEDVYVQAKKVDVSDKASMLDEAIEYLKSLQMQVQVYDVHGMQHGSYDVPRCPTIHAANGYGYGDEYGYEYGDGDAHRDEL
ncbi:hypothetical protein L1987_60111 [Smallanthus sonchifolius]|uniref:Uncharacterized protein n=1 Tax=Smallanthus sonchifolius TaxID=185202 RepID=A0ACB9D751_9ASTR|nr:hypothetical protein L1987_60111 [Smallanthus sonchifolius]